MPGKKLELPQVRRHTSIYKDDDYLSAAQAAEVLSENSGRIIDPKNLWQLVKRRGWQRAQKVGARWLYNYGEIKDVVISPNNAGWRRSLEAQQNGTSG